MQITQGFNVHIRKNNDGNIGVDSGSGVRVGIAGGSLCIAETLGEK